MKNFKLVYKLSAAFLVVALISAFSGLLSLSKLSDTNKVTNAIATNTIPDIEAISVLEKEFNSIRRLTFKAALAESAEEKEEAIQLIAVAKERVKQSADKYVNQAVNAEERAYAKQLDVAVTDYFAVNAKTIGVIKSATDTKPVHDIMFGPGADKFAVGIAILDEMTRYAHAQAADEIAAADSSFHVTTYVVIGSMVLTVLASIIMVAWLVQSVSVPVSDAVAVADEIAQGNLSVRISASGRRDEVGKLQTALQTMRDQLAELVATIQSSSSQVELSCSEIESGNNDLSSRTEQQAGALEETASSMEEFASTVQLNADAARRARTISESASDSAATGSMAVAQVVDSMNKINTASRNITEIVGVIEGLAFQTNLLALNAAVEAAHAGDQGRGFAVVATEVRSLAAKSAEAAKQIKLLVDTSLAEVAHGVSTATDASGQMSAIVDSIHEVTVLISEIANASAEQNAGIGQLNEAVMQLDQMTQQNAALVEEMAAATSSLKSQATGLVEQTQGFKT